MLAEFIERLYNNRKKYLYCFLAFVVSATIAGFGWFKGLIILGISALGYWLGDEGRSKKLKKKIRDMADD